MSDKPVEMEQPIDHRDLTEDARAQAHEGIFNATGKECTCMAPKFAPLPLLSFIVPIYQVEKDTLKRCLLSLEDQDYENIEVVCVMDGPDAPLVNVVCEFLVKHKEWKVLEIEHAGACAARNAGFNASKGEIVSFFNSDYIAKPGMARMWVTELQAHPDCGFVYGGYEYLSSQRSWYASKQFDPWVLEVANYIDCGFPLWRKYVVPWDVNCKSLQDWDFWLKVVRGGYVNDNGMPIVIAEHGVKGHYLGREVSFVAEPPRAGGLSMDSSSNWTDRVKYVKVRNGIPQRDICVASLGAPNHGLEIAKMIDADFRDDTIFKPHAYKALYLIGWYMKPNDPGNDHPNILAHFDRPGVSRIVHFVGADIFWLRKFPFDSLRYIAGALRLKTSHILCETDLAQRELAEMGIPAQIVPIPSYSRWEMRPLPEKFTCAVFLTAKSDFDKYCFEPTLSIIRSMPDVEFHAYGDGGWDVQYPNLVHHHTLPRPEWEKFVYAQSCYLRLVRHDTLPLASSEFIMAGRDVVTNIPLPYQEYIDTSGKKELNDWDIFNPGFNAFNWPDTKKDVIQRIRAIKSRKAGNCFEKERIEAATYWNTTLDQGRYIETIRALALEKEPQNADKQLETSAVASD